MQPKGRGPNRTVWTVLQLRELLTRPANSTGQGLFVNCQQRENRRPFLAGPLVLVSGPPAAGCKSAQVALSLELRDILANEYPSAF